LRRGCDIEGKEQENGEICESEMEGTITANVLDDEYDAHSDVAGTGIKEHVSVWKSSCGETRAYD